jgi:hypothetical protein
MWASCSVCGQEDTVENITREAGEYFAEKSLRDMFSRLSEGSSVISVESEPERIYRWITGD